jgi:hypothetical protein
MIYLAFYRGEGRFLSDTLVQHVTRSEFSHCELFVSDTPPCHGETYRCVTAVGKQGGVCVRDIHFRPGAYEFLPVPWAPRDTFDRAAQHLGMGYDYWGLLMTQFINMRRHAPDRWFCSKLCAKAMGLKDPHTYAPGDLKRIVEEHNRTYAAAQELVVARKSAIRPRFAASGAPFFPGSGTFAGGILAAGNPSMGVMSQLTDPHGGSGVRANAPLRVAKRTQGIAATRPRTREVADASEATVVEFPGRVAR